MVAGLDVRSVLMERDPSGDGFGFRLASAPSVCFFPEWSLVSRRERSGKRLSPNRFKMSDSSFSTQVGERGGDQFAHLRTDQTGGVQWTRVPRIDPPVVLSGSTVVSQGATRPSCRAQCLLTRDKEVRRSRSRVCSSK